MERRTVTFMVLPLRADVVTSHATMPAINPAIEPPMLPHLFAFFQLMHSAMGTTAEPSTTPMNSCGALLCFVIGG